MVPKKLTSGPITFKFCVLMKLSYFPIFFPSAERRTDHFDYTKSLLHSEKTCLAFQMLNAEKDDEIKTNFKLPKKGKEEEKIC